MGLFEDISNPIQKLEEEKKEKKKRKNRAEEGGREERSAAEMATAVFRSVLKGIKEKGFVNYAKELKEEGFL